MSTSPNEPTQPNEPTPPTKPETDPKTGPQPDRPAQDPTPDRPAQEPTASQPTTGQHAAPRPAPPAPPAPDRQPTGMPERAATAAPDQAARPPAAEHPTARPPAGQPPVPASAPPAGPSEPHGDHPHPQAGSRAEADAPARDLPEAPSRPGAGRHLLAALLGLVLTPFALTLVGIGTGRLADIAGTSDMGTDLLGGTLLSLGVLMLAVIVLLGVWSVALPIVGGLVWGVGLGAAYLVVPSAMRDGAEAMTVDGSVPVEIEQLADAGMNGSLLLLGALLVAAGLATSLARRRGRRWAQQVAVAEHAKANERDSARAAR